MVVQTLLMHASSHFACGGYLFGLPHWDEYLQHNGDCSIALANDPDAGPGALIGTIPLIGLAVLDMLLRVAGTAALVMVFYGAFRYVSSQGSPDATAEAQNTIVNALVGMVIAIISAGLVSYIGHRVGG